MKNISLKLDDDIFAEMEKITAKLKLTRNSYINEAVSMYNLVNKRRFLKKELRKESLDTTADSMEVLEEFESLMNQD